MMEKNSKILVAGANGMVGSAIVRNLESKGYCNIIKGTRNDVDFTNQEETERYFCSEEPEYVFLSAAKVGGIAANKSYPAEFIYDNLMIQSKIMGLKNCYFLDHLAFIQNIPIFP